MPMNDTAEMFIKMSHRLDYIQMQATRTNTEVEASLLASIAMSVAEDIQSKRLSDNDIELNDLGDYINDFIDTPEGKAVSSICKRRLREARMRADQRAQDAQASERTRAMDLASGEPNLTKG